MAAAAKAGLVEAEYETDIPFTNQRFSYKATKDEPLYMFRFDRQKPGTKKGYVKTNF